MKRSDFLKSTTAAGRGSVTEIHKSAAQGDANRIPAGKLWRIVRTGLAALTVSFLVSVGQAAAAPGEAPMRIQLLDQHPQLGHPVRLRALNLPAEHKHLLWYLEEQPPGSEAKFHNQTSSEASFVPDVLGLFRVRLTDGSDWTRTATLNVTVTLTTTAPTYPPLVPVNTITVNAAGQPGMQVGANFYPYDTSSGQGFQVVQVDRNTLQGQHNNTVLLNASDISTYTGYFQNTSASTLILVALPASAGPIPTSLTGAVNTWLATIGGFLPPLWTLSATGTQWLQSGASGAFSFSVIGVPGMAAGNAWFDSAAQRGADMYPPPNGALVGYLTQGTIVGNTAAIPYSFVFSPDQYVLVDSCASGWPNNCVIQVGSQTFKPQAGVNGIHVVLLDRVTLKLLTNQTVTSTQALFSALSTDPNSFGGIPQLGHVMQGFYNDEAPERLFSDRVVVVMQSIGTGALTYDAASPLLSVIDQLGGTPETFGTAITAATAPPYALIGVMSNLPWHGRGIESSPAMILGLASSNTATPFPGHARGILARDRLARYTPTVDDPVGTADLSLLPIVYQNLTPWPYAGSCSVEYIAVGLNFATDGGDPNTGGTGLTGYTDIRSKYWQDPGYNYATPVAVNYPTTFPWYCPQSSFLSPQDYSSLQQELTNEFNRVSNVYNFVYNDIKPIFNGADTNNNTIVAAVAYQVYQSIKPPPTANTSFSWVDAFNLAAAVASPIAPEASAALWVVSASGQMTADSMASSSTGDLAKKVITEAGQLVAQLDAQTTAHVYGLDRLFEILVADAGKLETVGLNLSANGAWAWGNTTGDANDVLLATTLQTAYSALLPPWWFGYNLKPDLVHQFSSNKVSTFGCGFNEGKNLNNVEGVNQAFKHAVPANQFQAQIQLVPGLETENTEVWTFGVLDGNFTSTGDAASVPSTSLTNSLFSIPPPSATPLSGSTPSYVASYGLAYPPAWWRSTYNPPSYVVCDNKNGSTDSYQGHPSGVIPPPAAAYGQQ